MLEKPKTEAEISPASTEISKTRKSLSLVCNEISKYPISTLFYCTVIYLGLFTKFNKFTFGFNYKVGYYFFIPLLLIFILLTCAKKLGGKKFFIETSNYVLCMYFLLILLIVFVLQTNKNVLDVFLIFYILILYLFYHSVFNLLILSIPKKNTSLSISDTRLNKLYFTLAGLAILTVSYFLYNNLNI